MEGKSVEKGGVHEEAQRSMIEWGWPGVWAGRTRG
jgi:hypothetical protein